MHLLYNLAGILIVILIIPVFLIRAVREQGFIERIRQSLFGLFPPEAIERVAKKNCIWVHASSVGEVVAASPLIKEFRAEFPKSPILVSVVTNNGYEMANRIIKDADSIIYFPLDLPWFSGHVLRKISPRVFMPVETELWPNFLRACRQMNIPVMMVNGRISDKSVKRYHLLGTMLEDMIGTVKKFAMQSSIDCEYIIQLGADPRLVINTGNTKYDQTYTAVSPRAKKRLITEMGLQHSDGILLAGSTHKGEEQLVIDAFVRLRKAKPRAALIIAPRELLRGGQVEELVKKAGLVCARRTELKKRPAVGHDAVILDTIGELGQVYSIGDVIFVGGSLIPHGGHNILEPAAHGKAIITGSNMFNFKETHVLFSGRNACVTVNDGAGLAAAVLELFLDDEKRRAMEEETLAIINENRGAARKSAVILHELLDEVEERRRQSGIIHATEKIENFQTYFFQLVHERSVQGFILNGFVEFLHFASFVYGGIVNLRLDGYRHRIFKKKKLPCFVISLGNVTVGGTGKTPTAQLLARQIRDLGYKVIILNRGYRAKWKGEAGVVSDGYKLYMDASEAGDEAFMLARHLPGIPVIIGPERYASGRYAIEHLGAQVAILDDGYQHWKLERDIDIVLIDAVNVFGNGYMLPRGTLREPIRNLDRADICLLTKVDQAAGQSREYIRGKIKQYNDRALVVESVHQPCSFVDLKTWKEHIGGGIHISEMKGMRVMAVSAIGNPSSFEQTLAQIGVTIVESLRYPDHHDYTPRDMISIIDQARRQDVEAIIITEKDAVKVPQPAVLAAHDEMPQIPIYVLSIEVQLKDGGEEMMALIRDRIEEKVGPAKRSGLSSADKDAPMEVFASREEASPQQDGGKPEGKPESNEGE